jgi:hypothetical protein
MQREASSLSGTPMGHEGMTLGMLREHAPRLDAAKPDPPSATGVVPYAE